MTTMCGHPSKLVMRVRFPSPAPTRTQLNTGTHQCPARHQEAVPFLRARCVPDRLLEAPFCRAEAKTLPHARSDRLIPLPGRMLVNQRSAGTGMPHTLHQLAQARPRGSRHRVSRMPQVMQVQPEQASLVTRLDPDIAEVGPAKPPALRADEHQAVKTRLYLSHWPSVAGEIGLGSTM